MQDLRQNIFTIDKAIDSFVEQNNRMQKPLNTEYEFLKWLDEGRMVVLGGGSGLGKTAYVLQMIYNLARDNKDDLIGIYASSEMMIEELTMRLLVNQSVLSKTYNITNIRQQFNSLKVDQETLDTNIYKAKSVLKNVPFYFLNSSQFNISDIITTIKATREKNPDKRIFIVIDYLQLLLLDGDTLNETNRSIKRLKDALVTYKANGIAISALNRDSIRNNYVDMSAFKDSSMIEYTSDIGILFAFKDDNDKYTLKVDDNSKDKDKIQFFTKCVKNRVGKLFSDKVEFDKLHQQFNFIEDTIIEYKNTYTKSTITIVDDDKETEESKGKIKELETKGFNFDD